ncbi:hypothetical protein J8TS2_18290 [Lederbergia ruris]|uniref:DUF3278 domain-containing protein n=1 Tax=Lederbergia ruris TaxID=217495 RepID=A0ABQ4KHS0_9BACI|nr:hypothetical protein [Lederbergia ruris]GIN57510.1 hypothetical protein J8TS2_18290 [Lederbergia ruris]
MKARYVLLTAFLSLFINGISLYNLPIGYISIFIMLLVFIPNLFMKIISFGKNRKAQETDHILVKAAIDFEKNTHSKAAYIFWILMMYIAGGALTFFQIHQYYYIDALVTGNIHWSVFYTTAPYLIGTGYVLFVASLVMMTIHFRKIFREAGMFKKHEGSKYVESDGK